MLSHVFSIEQRASNFASSPCNVPCLSIVGAKPLDLLWQVAEVALGTHNVNAIDEGIIEP